MPLSESSQGLLQVAIPAGRHRLDVTFKRDLADYVGMAISLATLLGLAAYVARRWRARHASPMQLSSNDIPDEVHRGS